MLDLFSPNACKKVPTLDLFLLSFYCFVDLFSPVGPCHGPFLPNTKMVPILDLFLLSFYCFVDLFSSKVPCLARPFFTASKRPYPYWTFCYKRVPILDLFPEGPCVGTCFSPDVCEKAHANYEGTCKLWTFSCYDFTMSFYIVLTGHDHDWCNTT